MLVKWHDNNITIKKLIKLQKNNNYFKEISFNPKISFNPSIPSKS